MTDREEFEKWLKENYTKGYITDSDRKLAKGAWQARGALDAVRIKELEDRLRFQDEWLSNGVYYTTEEAFKLHDEYNSKIAELTAKLDKAKEALKRAAEDLVPHHTKPSTYKSVNEALEELSK